MPALAYWGSPPETARRRSRRWLGAGFAVIAGLLALFALLTPSAPHPIDFTHDDWYAAYLTLYVTAYPIGELFLARACWRLARRSTRGSVRYGLRIVALGATVTLGYSAVRIGNVIAGAFDASLADWEGFAWTCGDVGAMLTLIGWLVPTPTPNARPAGPWTTSTLSSMSRATCPASPHEPPTLSESPHDDRSHPPTGSRPAASPGPSRDLQPRAARPPPRPDRRQPRQRSHHPRRRGRPGRRTSGRRTPRPNEKRGTFDGLPFTIKDSFETAGLRTTSGAEKPEDHVPERDADAVARLRYQGAVIMDKTNIPAYCQDVHTDNSLFGPTLNPHDPKRTAGGSSGGAAAAVAAHLTPADLGSDLVGSLRLPAPAAT